MRGRETLIDLRRQAWLADDVRASQERVLQLSAQVELRGALLVTLSAIFIGLLSAQGVRNGYPDWVWTCLTYGVVALLTAVLAFWPALRSWHRDRARAALRPAPFVDADEIAYLEQLRTRLEQHSLRFLRWSALLLTAAFVVSVIGMIVT
jgi:hypothetical protein